MTDNSACEVLGIFVCLVSDESSIETSIVNSSLLMMNLLTWLATFTKIFEKLFICHFEKEKNLKLPSWTK